MLSGISNKLLLLLVSGILAACGGFGSGGSSSTGTVAGEPSEHVISRNSKKSQQNDAPQLDLEELFNPANDNSDIKVNKYLWAATLETLSFLPIEAADPFSGVVVMGWGRAPGSSTDFRATILIQDPALEAGSLRVAMQKRSGPASAETNRQIEDAILTRARQLRIQGAKRR